MKDLTKKQGLSVDDTIIYHNPHCSKSRSTLDLLHEKAVQANVVRYLDTPPSIAELDKICTMLNVPPQSLVRTTERRFRELGLSLDDQRSRAEWLALLADNPMLLERPIVVHNGQARVGRPPTRILEIL